MKTLKPGMSNKGQASIQPNEITNQVGTIAKNLIEQTGTTPEVNNQAGIEITLMKQAADLDKIYNQLISRWKEQTDQTQFESLALALQAQGQYLATIEMLNSLKKQLKPAATKQTKLNQIPKKIDPLLVPKPPSFKEVALRRA